MSRHPTVPAVSTTNFLNHACAGSESTLSCHNIVNLNGGNVNGIGSI